MDSMTVRYEPDDAAWVFSAGDLGPGAPVAIVIGGLRWVVSNLACASPWEVSLDSPPSPWARDAIASLLGAAAAAALDGDPDGAEHEVAVDLDAAARRAAMGMLAVAATQPIGSPLRPIDIAALAHRAGLDALPSPMPGVDDLADAALEAWDLLPAALVDALEAVDDEGLATGEGLMARDAVRSALADVGRLIFRATNELLPNIDVDAVFDEMAANVGPDLWEAAENAPEVPVFMGHSGSEVPVFRGRPAGLGTRVIEDALVVDSTIRGVMGVTASFDADRSVARVRVSTRSIALHSASNRLLVRVVAEQTGAVIGCVPLERDPTPTASGRLSANLEIPTDVVPSRVELLLDPDQPQLDLPTARELDRQYWLLEGGRVLGQAGALSGDRRASVIAEHEAIASAIETLLGDLPEGFRPDVFPWPSDWILAKLASLSRQVVAGLEAIERPAERAASAHNTMRLLSWGMCRSIGRCGG